MTGCTKGRYDRGGRGAGVNNSMVESMRTRYGLTRDRCQRVRVECQGEVAQHDKLIWIGEEKASGTS